MYSNSSPLDIQRSTINNMYNSKYNSKWWVTDRKPRKVVTKNNVIITNDDFVDIIDQNFQNYSRVKSLLYDDDEKIDPSYMDNKPLRVACRRGFADIVKELLNFDEVDPSACDNEALFNACEKGYTNVVRLLMSDSRVDSTARDHYAVELTYLSGRYNILNLLIRVEENKKFWLSNRRRLKMEKKLLGKR